MSGESINCQVCYSEYDIADHLPRILLNCGHTMCSKCLLNLITNRNQFKCPFDQHAISSQSGKVEAFPVNFALKKLIEDKDNRELCPEHQQRLRLVCLTDKIKVCDECALTGSHSGHKIKPMTIIGEETNKKKVELRNALNTINKHEGQVSSIFQSKRNFLHDKVRSKFEEIRKVFLCSELELLSKSSSFLNFAVEKVDKELNIDRNLPVELSAKLEQQANIFKLPNFIEVMEEDVSTSISRFNPTLYTEHVQKVSQAIDRVTESVDNVLSEETNLLLENARSISCFGEKLESSVAEFFGSDSFLDRLNDHRVLELSTHLDFVIKDGCLNVTVEKILKTSKTINLNEWKDLKKISLVLSDYHLIQQDIKLLYYFWEKADKVTTVYIEFNHEGFSDSVITKFLPIIFDKYKQIEEVEIWLDKCKLSEQCFSFFFSRILNRLTAMRNLILIFDASTITDTSLQLLNDEVLSTLKELTVFRVDLFKTKVTDDGVVHLFKNIERMKEFRIHLQSTKITDKCIEIFSKDVLPTMKNLRNLCLWLGRTTITDESLKPLFLNLQDLEELRLDLMATKVTDASLGMFIESTIPRLVSIKTFDCLLGETSVGEENLKKVAEFQAKFEKPKKESAGS